MIAYPRGLIQPANCGKFALDTLLLAAFSAQCALGLAGERRVIELGSGCGAALIGYALLRDKHVCAGLEREAALVDAARENARLLQISERCAFIQTDIKNVVVNLKVYAATADLVMANPPWRDPLKGRVARAQLRKHAYWEVPAPWLIF